MTSENERIEFVQRPDGKIFVFYEARPYLWSLVELVNCDLGTKKSDLVGYSESRRLSAKFLERIVKPQFHELLHPDLKTGNTYV